MPVPPTPKPENRLNFANGLVILTGIEPTTGWILGNSHPNGVAGLRGRERDIMRNCTYALLVLLAFLVSGLADSQTTLKSDLTHEFILSFPALQKQVLFDKIVRWIENNFRSRKTVFDTEDPDVGLIVANGTTDVVAEGDSIRANLSFTMKVDVRDMKIRVRFVNLESNFVQGDGWDQVPEEGVWHRPAQKKFASLVAKLNDYLLTK